MPTTDVRADVPAGPRPLYMPRGRVSDRAVLLVASLGAFLAFLDATIVNVAFPSIRESFPESSISDLSWVLNSYNIMFAAFLVPAGRLADLIGRRRAFVWGAVAFTVMSVVCGLAPSVEFLVGARALQALGAAMLVPASLALVVQAFAPEHRTHAVGLWGAAAAVAAGLGPPLGGLLVELGDWRWAFFVNLPFGLATWWLAKRMLTESRAPGRRRVPDLRGAALFALALALLTTALVQGDSWGWGSAAVLACLLGAAAALAGFVWSSRVHRSPLLDPALLRIRPFLVGNIGTVLAGMGFYSYLLVNILWLQYVWGYSVLQAGLALVPGALVAAIVAAVLGPRAAASDYRLFVVPGALIWALAYVWYAARSGTEPDFLTVWLPGQVLSGIGAGATLPLLGSAALAAVPGGRYATASAMVSSSRQLGGVLGIALLVIIIGTPSPGTAADDLRPGWLFAVLVFTLTAVAALLLGRMPAKPDEADTDTDLTASVKLAAPRAPAASGELDALPLLGRLPDRVRTALTDAAVIETVDAGAYLIREGEDAHALYLVHEGRFEVLVGDEVVRELGPGDAVGELALLTGGTRSASVRARRDSSVARLTREDFDRIVRRDPAALEGLTEVLAAQLAQARPDVRRDDTLPSVVSVLAMHRGAPAERVARSLQSRLAVHRDTVLLDVGAVEELHRAEREHDTVVLVGAEPGTPAWEFARRQADHLVLVAQGGDPDDAPEIGHDRCDLVHVGPRPTREQAARWSERLEPWRTTYAGTDELEDALAPVARALSGTSVGVVMAGGGARAFAHIGVLAELAEAGITVDRVAGTSIGALMAALYAAGHSPAEIHEVCYHEFVRASPFSDYTLPTVSLAKGRRTKAGIERQLGSALIEELPRQFSCVSTDIGSRQRHVHRYGRTSDAVVASLALPVLFPPRRVEGRILVDGGVLDNLPVTLLTDRGEGPVLAVNIALGGSADGERTRPAGSSPRPPRIPGLGETLLRTMMIGSGGATAVALDRGATVVTPPPMGVGLLEFHQLDRIVESGRLAARALLQETGGVIPR